MFATVSALAVLPNGDIVVGGTVPTGTIRLARWPASTGSSSFAGSPWITGLGGSTSAAMAVNALAPRRDGALMAGGQFTVAGSPVTWQAARIDSTCPATTASHGSGCSGSAGPLVLSAVTAPWTGERFVARATPIAPGAFAFRIVGWGTQSVPLSLLHPAGGPGCDLLVTHDASSLLFATGGTVTWQLDIPNSAVFAGTILHSQIVQAELDAAANLILLSSSNRLTLSVGTY